MAEGKMASESLSNDDYMLGRQTSGFNRVDIFHKRMGLTVGDDWSEIPSVSERILRGKLLMEEVFETLKAMGLDLLIDGVPFGQGFENIGVVHVEGSRYDPIETADGLADVKVIANGTAVAFGIPQDSVDFEVWASNMSKLDENGEPIVNQCQRDCEDWCEIPEHLIDPTKPVGKLLKPDSYVPANIAELFHRYTGKLFIRT
jgi:predicted HAD superfamily Cof-like phosphohydrolase